MNIRHFRAKNRGRRLRRRPLRCLWGFCASFRAGLRARVQRSVQRVSRGSVVLRVSFSVVVSHPRRRAGTFERAASPFADDSFFRDASFSRISRSFLRSFLRSPAGISPLRRRPPRRRRRRRNLRLRRLRRRRLRRRRRSRRLFVADDPPAPGGPRASPRASGTNQPLFPRLPPSLRLGVPAGAASEEDALSAAASLAGLGSETKAREPRSSGSTRHAALDADACSCVKVSPPATRTRRV